jgi:HSP20 family protein
MCVFHFRLIAARRLPRCVAGVCSNRVPKEFAMSTALASQPTRATSIARDPIAALRREMDDLVARFWDGNQEGWFSQAFVPSADLSETENAYEIRMDIPGMEAKDINVQVQGNVVTLSGDRKEEKEEKGKTYHKIERRVGGFSRMITLPSGVNEDEVAADYNQGVLTVKLPKREEAKSKKVNVKG